MSVDSRELAKVLNRKHADLLKRIREFLEKEVLLPEDVLEDKYEDPTGRSLIKYDLSEDGTITVILTLVPSLIREYVKGSREVPHLMKLAEKSCSKSKAKSVYLIKDTSANREKIGISQNPFERLRDLQTAAPTAKLVWHSDQTLLATKIEREIHKKFEQSRISDSEWFKIPLGVALAELQQYFK